MTAPKINVSEELLAQQIGSFTNFEKEFTPGGTVKSVMAGVKARDLYQYKPEDLVVVDGFNPRTQNADYFAGIETLAQNMLTHGFMQDKPLSGYISKQDGKDVVIVNDGHRRLAAVKRAKELGAKISTIPLVLKERGDNMTDLTISLLHSNEGQPFTMYEKAVIAKRLKHYGMTNAEIAKEMGCTGAFVGELLTLAGAPQAIQELVKAGAMSGTLAVQTIKTHGENASAVAKSGAAAAAARGKGKTTAKDSLTPVEQKTRNAKKVAYELYKALTKLFENEKAVKALDDKVYTEMDALIAVVEKKAKVKVPKEPKPIKVKAEKKAPLAKKIAGASKKKPKANGADGAAFFDNLNKAQAEKKEARAQASKHVARQRRSDR